MKAVLPYCILLADIRWVVFVVPRGKIIEHKPEGSTYRVVVHHDTSTVSDRFTDAAHRNSDAVEICSLLDAKSNLCNGNSGEGCGKESTPSKVGKVPIDCIVNRAPRTQVRTVGDVMLLHLECWKCFEYWVG